MSAADSNNRLVKRQPAFCPHTSADINTCGQAVLPTAAFHFHPKCYYGFFFLISHFSFHAALFSYPYFLSGLSVCSSAPVSMKIQPLNQTALMVSWERPLTIYHPPIKSYMVSYSWVKSDVADEKTFTKTGDQSMVSIIKYSHKIKAVCQDNLDFFFSLSSKLKLQFLNDGYTVF